MSTRRNEPAKPRAGGPVVLDVLTYFVRHPQCVDDLDGIARWRLSEQMVTSLVLETNRALEWLVAEQLLVCEATPGLAPRYRLDPQQTVRAAALVEERAGIEARAAEAWTAALAAARRRPASKRAGKRRRAD